MKNVKKLVSIIIPTYRRPTTLERAINSALNQEYSPIEVIVVDDNNPNTDDRSATEQVMKKYEHFENVKYFKHPCNRNGSAARNTGAKNAKGDFYCFLDDDDEYFPQKIKMQVERLEQLDSSWGICYCKYIRKRGNKIVSKSAEKREGWIAFHELCRNFWHGGGSGPLVRKDVFWKVGGFDERFKRNQDYEYMLKITKLYKVAFVDVFGMAIYVDSFHEKQTTYYQVLQNFCDTFKKDIDELDPCKKANFYKMIALQTIRYELFEKKNVKKCLKIKSENKISFFLMTRYLIYLFYRKLFKISVGFNI